MTPLRYLWAFSPQSGRVHLYDETEHHPADQPTHQSIADELGEIGVTHGYAYTIPGGWRVLDYEHKAVADPYVRKQVIEALGKNATPPDPVWEPEDAQAEQYHYGQPVMSSIRTADKLHGFLMNPKSRPDLQTPEGQRWLRYLDEYHTPKLDPLMPWLTREWKKGRLTHHPTGDDDVGALYHPDGPGIERHVAVSELSHWGDFMASDHPIRRDLGDIMQHQLPAFQSLVRAWDDDMAAQAHDKALAGGKVVHTTPDGWTVRQLRTPDELQAEGDAMGHCVGGYHDLVRQGRSLIYSLRDPAGRPHATAEIEPHDDAPVTHSFDFEGALNTHPVTKHLPDWAKDEFRNYAPYLDGMSSRELRDHSANEFNDNDEGSSGADWPELYRQLRAEYSAQSRPPERGGVVQIQGKGNEDPKPEYKARLRHWFESFPPETRPLGEDNGYGDHISHAEDIEDHHLNPDTGTDAYGLIRRPPEVDYDGLFENLSTRHFNQTDAVDRIYDLAVAQNHIPRMAVAAEDHMMKQDDLLRNWMDMNYESIQHQYDPDSWGELPADEAKAAEQAYYAEQAEWAEEHEGFQAASRMMDSLKRHYWGPGEHPDGKVGYRNELRPLAPAVFS